MNKLTNEDLICLFDKLNDKLAVSDNKDEIQLELNEVIKEMSSRYLISL